MDLYDSIMEMTFEEESIEQHKEKISLLMEAQDRTHFLKKLNEEIRYYIRKVLKIKLNPDTGIIRNIDFKKEKTNTILIDFNNFGADYVAGVAMGLISPIIITNSISSTYRNILYDKMNFDDLEKRLNDTFGKDYDISVDGWSHGYLKITCTEK